jgi:hypothetical protein
MKIAADGKIYVHGGTGVIVRLNADFSLDTTWSHDGIASVIAPDADPRIGEFSANLADLEIQADGSVLAVVMSRLRAGGGEASADNPILIRFRADGTTESAVTMDVPPGAPRAHGEGHRTLNAVEVGPDGTILIAGEAVPLARVFRDDAPIAHAGENAGGAITGAAASDAYTFAGAAHDRVAHATTTAALDGGELQVVTPGGGRFNARAVGRTHRADGSTIVRYRTCAANGTTSGEQQGGSTLYVLGARFADVAGALAAGRALGTFSVHVAPPMLSTAEVAVGLSRDKAYNGPVVY